MPRHRAWNIHAYSSGVSSTVTSTSTNPTAVWFPSVHIRTSHRVRRSGRAERCSDRLLPFVQATLRLLRKPCGPIVFVDARTSRRLAMSSATVSDAERIHGSRSARRRSALASSPAPPEPPARARSTRRAGIRATHGDRQPGRAPADAAGAGVGRAAARRRRSRSSRR